ncbi:hypothetical protein BVC80_881g68 [Macleaya cordata]|uniref:Uncharacterized protein n=1 Tax=Macleaya cordata TaxID=56857 RepID=A0A200RDA5_MACCD|nr:hypothetical protein BVC80_881g68 [Macleaya cordata]
MAYEGGTKGYYSSSSSSSSSSFGLTEQRIAMGVMVIVVCGFVWYIVYDAIMVTAAEQLKPLLMVSPLLLVIVVHWLSMEPTASTSSSRRQLINYNNMNNMGEPAGAIHRAGGSPWGIATVLLLLCFLISYQPSLYRLSSL